MSKYVQIANIIRKRIVDGEYEEDSFLPYHTELSKEFEVSRMTIQKAINILTSEGLVITKRGYGTKVLKNTVKEGRISRLNNYNEMVSNSIKDSNKLKKEVKSFDVKFPNLEVQNILEINEEEPIYEVLRLHFSGDLAITLEKLIVPAKYAPMLTRGVLENSIQDYLSNDLNYKIYGVRKSFTATKAKEEDQEFLRCTIDDPILELEQLVYSEDGVPLYLSFSHISCDSSGYRFFELR